MPRKKPPQGPTEPDAGAWRVILEDIRSQMGVFGDALQTGLREVRQEMAEGFQRTDQRLTAVEAAVRQNSADIRQNSTDIKQNSADIRQNSTDIRSLTTRVERLERIEERVTALEQRRP